MCDSSDGLALGGLKSYLAFGNNFELDFTHECARSAQEKILSNGWVGRDLGS